MRRAADLLFFSSLFIALCAAALGAATYVLLGSDLRFRVLGFIFAGTLFIYNSHALYTNQHLQGKRATERHNWVKKRRNCLVAASFLALAACIYLLDSYNFSFYIWLLHLLVLAIGYTVPVVPYKKKWINLRSAPLLKVLLIAYVWAAVTVQLPLLSQGVSLADSFSYFILYGRFVFILALAPLFDIRDVKRDADAKIITLPTLIGQRGSKAFSVVLLLIFAALVFQYYQTVFALALFISAVAAIIVVLAAKQGQTERFYSGWADGMMLLQALLVIAADFFFR